MMNLLRSVAVIAISFGVACSPPKVKDKDTSKDKATAPTTQKGEAEKRADELIDDLKKRQMTQEQIHQKAREHVPVVVEVSPKGSSYSRPAPVYGGSNVYLPPQQVNQQEVDYWRQQFGMAAAKLQASQMRMEQARQRMNSSASQARSTTNQTDRKTGEEAYQRASADFNQAQADVYQDQQALDAARSAALRAGVPVSYLR